MGSAFASGDWREAADGMAGHDSLISDVLNKNEHYSQIRDAMY